MKSNQTNFIKRLKSGKEDALDYIVDHYFSLIKGIVYKILVPLNRNGLIDECINDIFLSIWHNAKKFKGSDEIAFKKWICTIARFKAIDYYRKVTKKYEISTDYLEIAGNNSVEQSIISQENYEELMKLIYQLDPIDQKIFIMKFLLDLHSDEIAQKLGMTSSAINSRIYRGKKKLAKKAALLNWEVITLEKRHL